MRDSESKCDPHHEHNKAWGVGISTIITKVRKGVAASQEARETERDKSARMDGGGVGAMQHADTTQEGGPGMRQQLQLQLNPRLQLKLQPQLHHKPKPKSAPTSVRQWETVPLRAKGQRAPVAPGPALMAGSGMAERRQKPR